MCAQELHSNCKAIVVQMKQVITIFHYLARTSLSCEHSLKGIRASRMLPSFSALPHWCIHFLFLHQSLWWGLGLYVHSSDSGMPTWMTLGHQRTKYKDDHRGHYYCEIWQQHGQTGPRIKVRKIVHNSFMNAKCFITLSNSRWWSLNSYSSWHDLRQVTNIA